MATIRPSVSPRPAALVVAPRPCAARGAIPASRFRCSDPASKSDSTRFVCCFSADASSPPEPNCANGDGSFARWSKCCARTLMALRGPDDQHLDSEAGDSHTETREGGSSARRRNRLASPTSLAP